QQSRFDEVVWTDGCDITSARQSFERLWHSAGSASDTDCRFCCAACLRVLPKPPNATATAASSRGRRQSRASGAIGLPPAAAAKAAASADAPAAAEPATATEESSASAIDAASASPSDSVAAAEMENKSLMQEAERVERSLLNQEQTRQLLVEKNCRAEKKLEGLLAQFSKVNGM
uniref:UVR domain-containing protein n=1 Tax=Macrostomum lignano TaxID=282301 RepID=A0A1I8F7V0_9PLAT